MSAHAKGEWGRRETGWGEGGGGGGGRGSGYRVIRFMFSPTAGNEHAENSLDIAR